MHNINKSQVSLLNMLRCDRPGIAQGLNIFVITEVIITTLFDRVLKVRQIQATEGFCAYLKK